MADLKTNADIPLAAEFPPASRDAWLKLAEAVLKGRPFEKLVSRSHDGLAIGPIYSRAAEAVPVEGRAVGMPWQIMQRVDHPEPVTANALALQDLENGATGLTLTFAGSIGACGYGLAADGIARALEGVHLDAGVAVELDLPPLGQTIAEELTALLARQGVAPASADIRFAFDPIGTMAHVGWGQEPWKACAPKLVRSVVDLAARGFKGPFVAADGRVVHAAGGSEVQELAFALAVAIEYLRALEAGGMSLDSGRRTIFFRMAADADQFLTIAKLRALRRLWARVEEACGLVAKPAFVSVETAWRMMTRRDPHVNMLRAAMAVFSAAVGGADAISALPFSAALGLPDALGRRVARNTQLLLAEELNLARVSDPSAGAGALEDLTEQLCVAAWSLFQEIERAGGATAALEAGFIQKKVASVREARERAVAHRTDVLTGTTEFPQIEELRPAVLDAAPPPVVAVPAGALRIAPLEPVRLAASFEALRDAADRAAATAGSRPRVFLATLGAPADFTARATFARNFFEVGGVQAVGGEGFARLPELIAAFREAQAKLVCLCSSDEVYGREAVGAARTLVDVGAACVYLAGRPGERETVLREAGVEGFVYAGCDVLTTLRGVHAILGL